MYSSTVLNIKHEHSRFMKGFVGHRLKEPGPERVPLAPTGRMDDLWDFVHLKSNFYTLYYSVLGECPLPMYLFSICSLLWSELWKQHKISLDNIEYKGILDLSISL